MDSNHYYLLRAELPKYEQSIISTNRWPSSLAMIDCLHSNSPTFKGGQPTTSYFEIESPSAQGLPSIHGDGLAKCHGIIPNLLQLFYYFIRNRSPFSFIAKVTFIGYCTPVSALHGFPRDITDISLTVPSRA